MTMNDVEEQSFRSNLRKAYDQMVKLRVQSEVIEAEHLLVDDGGYLVGDALDNILGYLDQLAYNQYHEPARREGCGNPDCCDVDY